MKFKLSLEDQSWEFVLALTDAPVAYDYHGTFTVRDFGYPIDVGGITTKGPVRLVAIRPEHYDYQAGRYGSGLHFVTQDLESAAIFNDDVAHLLFELLKKGEVNK